MNVFDTSAVLAILYDEDGRAFAEDRVDRSVISSVNLAEVLRDLVISYGGGVEDAYEIFSRLPLAVTPPDVHQAKRAAELKAIKGLSLGDCFCIALGESRRAPLVTADQDWTELSLSVPVELIRTARHARSPGLEPH
jgi:PIN domain nuclease of toxin-antitoxin system